GHRRSTLPRAGLDLLFFTPARTDMRFDTARTLTLPLVALLALAACDDDSTGPVQVAAPTGVQAVASGPGAVQVTWNEVSNADAYHLDRAADGSPFSTIQSDLSTTTYQDS